MRLTYGLNSLNQVTIMEEDNYYPFGMKHKGYNSTTGMDVLAEFFPSVSPMAFELNNPVYFSDPTGLCPLCPDPKIATEAVIGGTIWLYNASVGEWEMQGDQLKEATVYNNYKRNGGGILGMGGSGFVDGTFMSGVKYGGGSEENHTDVRLSVVEPTPLNLLAVAENVVTVTDLIRRSPMGDFVRNGRPLSSSISSTMKVTGAALGGLGIGITGYQYAT